MDNDKWTVINTRVGKEERNDDQNIKIKATQKINKMYR